MIKFEWDNDKASSNEEKHGLPFELAAQVFLDDERLIMSDKRFEYGEDRLITFGHIQNRVCVVVYTERKNIIRIISARKANKKEQRYYEQNNLQS